MRDPESVGDDGTVVGRPLGRTSRASGRASTRDATREPAGRIVVRSSKFLCASSDTRRRAASRPRAARSRDGGGSLRVSGRTL